jgi:putative Holliday junction resolvase
MRLQGDLLGVDLGMRRTGVARLNTIARISEPLREIDMDKEDFYDAISLLVSEHEAVGVVVGLPRGLDGQETAQTAWTRDIIDSLTDFLSVPVFFTDEAGTTKVAEQRSKTGDSVDSVAAGVILEDFATQIMQGKIEDVTF